MRDRLEDLRVKLQDVINLVMESNNQIAVAKAHGEEGKRNVEKAKLVIERARESLKVTLPTKFSKYISSLPHSVILVEINEVF